MSDAQLQKNLAFEAQGYYRESAALLEPLATRTRTLMQHLAPMFEHWAHMDVIADDLSNAREHKSKARDYYRELAMEENVRQLEAELAALAPAN